jgi:hypothetical protein
VRRKHVASLSAAEKLSQLMAAGVEAEGPTGRPHTHTEHPQSSRNRGAEIGDIDDAVTEFGVVLADQTATLGPRASRHPPDPAVTTAPELSDSIVAHSHWRPIARP